MSRTMNTDPYEVQLKNGRDHWEVCSQRDLHVVSKVRQERNRYFRNKVRQEMRMGNYDSLPISKRDAVWWAW